MGWKVVLFEFLLRCCNSFLVFGVFARFCSAVLVFVVGTSLMFLLVACCCCFCCWCLVVVVLVGGTLFLLLLHCWYLAVDCALFVVC